MKKKISVLFLIILIFTVFVNGKLVNVAVIDKKKVYNNYSIRPLIDIKIDYFKDKINEEINTLQKQLGELQNKLNNEDLTPEEKNTIYEEMNNINKQIFDKKNDLSLRIEDYYKRREEYIWADINEAIKKVASQYGFSIVLDLNSSNIVYYTEDVDITGKVLTYLAKMILNYCKANGIDIDKYVYLKKPDATPENNNNYGMGD